MEFSFSMEQEKFREEVESFVKREVAPGAMKRDKEARFPIEIFDKLSKSGYMGISIPSEYGGVGLGCIEYAILEERLGKACPSTAAMLNVQYIVERSILILGNHEQKVKYLVDLAEGRKIGTFAGTEISGGSDVRGFQTAAVEEGDCFVLNGSKAFINNALEAGICIVVAKTKYGIDFFIVEKERPGISIGRRFFPMGMRAATIYEVILNNCRVPRSSLIGRFGEGVKAYGELFDFARIGEASWCIGISEAALEGAIKYASERKVGSGVVTDFQVIRHKIADIATKIEATRLLRDKAAWLIDMGKISPEESSMARLFASETAITASLEAVQICGAYGCMEDAPFERYMRDAKIGGIEGGTIEIQKNTIAKYVIPRYNI
jgi:alkylation response protein AidB-like acyl-CoA dehydrogenase